MVPSFSIRSRRMISMSSLLLLHDVRQQADLPAALDRLGELALLLGADGGDAAGNDLATLGDESLEQADVLIIDLGGVLPGERAGLAAAEKRAGHQSRSSRASRRLRSRSFLRIITLGPVSCSSTRIVR